MSALNRLGSIRDTAQHRNSESRQHEQRPPVGGPLLAAAVVLGWVAHDVLMFVLSGEPKLALEGLPRTLGFLTLAMILGAVIATFPELLAVLLLASGTAALALPRLGLGFDLTQTSLSLVAAVFALSVALSFASLWRRVLGGSALRAGGASGAIACVAFWWLQRDMESASLWLTATAAGLLLFGLIPFYLVRLTASAALVAAFVGYVVVPVIEAAPRVLREDRGAEALRLPGARGTRPDLVLVVMDTVRADRLKPYGYGRATTPLLDAFARRHAVRYTNARSTSSWTLPSHASLFTGLMPAQHGATHPRQGASTEHVVDSAALPAQPLRSDVPTLASLLRDAGYRTGAVLANSAYLDPRFGLGRGFEHYDARPGGFLKRYLPLSQLAGGTLRAGHLLYRDAKTITDLALAWLEQDDGRPFFLAVNYMDAHAPYLPPPPYSEHFGGPAREPLELAHTDRSDQYDRALMYLDAQLARLLNELDLQNTLVVITSDHGEALGDHGYWMHSWTLYDPVVRVPLYVKPLEPRKRPARDDPINGAEVFHMILGALDVEGPQAPEGLPRGLFGEWYRLEHTPTSPVLRDKHVERDLVGWVADGHQWIVASTGEVEVYDLAADPGETSPLTVGEEAVERARHIARSWWSDNPPVTGAEASPFDEAEQERLKALGYLGGDS